MGWHFAVKVTVLIFLGISAVANFGYTVDDGKKYGERMVNLLAALACTATFIGTILVL